MLENKIVSVVGLGYVGLPLAVEFGKRMATIGFDLNEVKLSNYRKSCDPTGEVSEQDLRLAANLTYTSDTRDLARADFFIVAVPTPVDDAHQPDFSPLYSACKTIAPHMKKGAIVIFESTVYPGATEEVCIPVLEEGSGKRWMQDFHVGYSPERINPGDKEHTLTSIVKVVSGDDANTLEAVAQLYEMVVKAGVFRASSIKAAEAAKVIENTQRDLNIALMNELAIIFHKIGIDTLEVLEAAGTKWNFLPFRPGLVGGHCNELKTFGVHVSVHDPVADTQEAAHEYGVKLCDWKDLPSASAIVAAVAHNEFLAMGMADLLKKLERGGCFIDVKSRFNAKQIVAAGAHVWRL
ncbi:MAG: nucleotide sugar dehydrogenase [Proteobacteria bacterium]|nr:nucleotide sugar dehydrogenase [Pseudomonadota bacterium]